MELSSILGLVWSASKVVAPAAVLNVMSFNIWGLPDGPLIRLSKERVARVQLLCKVVQEESKKSGGLDVILFQEAWMAQDRNFLARCGYAHSQAVDDPFEDLDSGLMILSRYPIKEGFRVIYQAQGDWSNVTHDGEAMVRKSAQIAQIIHPAAGSLWIGNTHTIAVVRGEKTADRYYEQRKAQLREYVDSAEKVSGRDPVILGGDWNTGPGYALWNELRPSVLSEFSSSPQAEQANACTYCPPNTEALGNEGQLDHLVSRKSGQGGLEPVFGSVAMTQAYPIRGRPMNLSDHFAWYTRFEMKGK